MADNDIKLNILTDISNSLKNLEKFQKDAAKQFDLVSKSAAQSSQKVAKETSSLFDVLKNNYGKIAAGLSIVAGVLAAREIISAISGFVEEASKGEQALQNLNTALAVNGDFSVEASTKLEQYAEKIEQTTKFDKDLVLSQLAVAKSYGLSNEAAQKLVDSSIELSSATGISLDSAVSKLGKTLSGNAGALARQIPALRNLSEEALKSGAAFKVVSDQFSGTAASQAQSFSGAVTILSNAFGALSGDLGDVIVQNPVVVAAINGVKDVVLGLQNQFKGAAPAIKEFVGNMVKLAVSAIPPVIRGIQLLSLVVIDAFKAVSILGEALVSLVRAFINLGPIKSIIQGVFGASINILNQFLMAMSNILKSLSSIPGGSVFKEMAVAIDELASSINSVNGEDVFNSLDTSLASVNEGIGAGIANANRFSDIVNQVGEFGATSFENLSESIANVDSTSSTTLKGLENLNKKGIRTLGEGIDDLAQKSMELDEAIKGSFDKLKQSVIDLQKEYDKQTLSRRELIEAQRKASEELASNAEKELKSQGKLSEAAIKQIELFRTLSEEKAKRDESKLTAVDDFVDSSIAKSAVAFATPISAFIEGAKGVVSAVSGFLRAIPDFLNSVSSLFDQITGLPEELFNSIDKLFGSITSLLRNVLANLFKNAGKILISAFTFLLKDLPTAILEAIKELPAIIDEVLAQLPDILVSLADNLPAIIEQLVIALSEATPRIAIALVDSLILEGGALRIAIAFSRAVAIELPVALAKGFLQGIQAAGETTFRALADFFSKGIKFPDLKAPNLDLKIPDGLKDYLNGSKFRDAIVGPFNKLVDGIKSALSGGLSGGGGGIGGAVGKIGKSLGFSSGGTVPEYAASGLFVPRGTDTVPAMLTPGELVIPTNDVDRLSKFLDRQDNGGIDRALARVESLVARNSNAASGKIVEVKLQVGERELAQVLLDLNNQGFRVA